MTSTNEGLIRQDRLGRFRFSKEQREALLDAFESSGMSGSRFAAALGVKYQTFATWVQKRKAGRIDASGSTVATGIVVGACRDGSFS